MLQQTSKGRGMTKRSIMVAVLFGMMECTAAEASGVAAPVPDFQTLESEYAQDASLNLSRKALLSAIPSGTSFDAAQRALSEAGAQCKPSRRGLGEKRCLVHQYSLADGAADDIRWTILLKGNAGLVSDLSVSRYVDRHGSN